ncbi:MAG: glycosyltransferase family 39 protein [Cyanobacteriota/Melainabacteria group bacterium]
MIATIFQKIFRRDFNPETTKRINRVLNRINFRTIFYIGGLVLLTGLAFGVAIDGFFVADDMWQVNFADKVLRGGRTELIWRNFTSNYLQIPSLDFYRPLLGFTFLLDYAIYGVRAWGYHLTSLLLYLCSVILIFILFRRMTRTWPENGSQSVAYLGAALFAVSPLHCEDVCWISGRADLLAAPFYLLSLWSLVKSHQEKNKTFYILSLVFFVLTMLSKEIGIGLPVVIAAYYFIWPKEEEYLIPVDIERPKFGTTKFQQDRLTRHKAHMEMVLKEKRKKQKKKEEKRKVKVDEASSVEPAEIIDGDSEDSEDNSEMTLKERIVFALKNSAPFIVIALIYLGIRYMALGTIIGGYGGMIGSSLDQHLILRWLDLSYLVRTLIPIPQAIAAQSQTPYWTIAICLVACLAVGLIRVFAKSDPRKWVCFLIIWMLATTLPLVKLWGVGHDLETSRLLFFFTMAYSALWPVLMFHPARLNAGYKMPRAADAALGIFSALLLASMIIAYAWTAFSTSVLWMLGGQELKSVWLQTIEKADLLGPDEKMILLGIPKDYHGAHVSFNGSTFHTLLRPPFTRDNLSQKVLTFEPYIVGPPEVINSSRLLMTMATGKVKQVYVWNAQAQKLEVVSYKGNFDSSPVLDLPLHSSAKSEATDTPVWKFVGKGKASYKNGMLSIEDTVDGDALTLSGLNLVPFTYNFFEADIRVRTKDGSDKQSKKDLRGLIPMALSWNHSSVDRSRSDWMVIAVKPDKLKAFEPLKLRPSHYYRWYTEGAIKSLILRLPDGVSVDIKGIRLIRGEDQIPFVYLPKRHLEPNGEYKIEDLNKETIAAFDAGMVKGAVGIEAELSRANYFFDNYLMSDHSQAVLRRLKLDAVSGNISLKPELFGKPAYYQLRVRALDKSGEPVGVWSDPVTMLRVGDGLDTYIE